MKRFFDAAKPIVGKFSQAAVSGARRYAVPLAAAATVGGAVYLGKQIKAKSQPIELDSSRVMQLSLEFDKYIREGNDKLASKMLDEAEGSFSKALRIVYEDKTVRLSERESQIVCFEKLADVCLARKDYVKATAMYNFAWAICEKSGRSPEQIQQKLKLTEKSFLESIGQSISSSTIDLDISHRETLKDIREEAKKRLDQNQDVQEIYTYIQNRLINDLTKKLFKKLEQL